MSLTKQEKKWLLERRVTRLTDNKEVQIYPMGAERYLSAVLEKEKRNSSRHPDPERSEGEGSSAISTASPSGDPSPRLRLGVGMTCAGKDILVIPGYGNTGFLFAEAGAKSVTVYDKDPVTIAWVKAFKQYYHYREQGFPSIGELLTALTCWYPPYIPLPFGKYQHRVLRILQPNGLRRVYLHYLLELVQQAVRLQLKEDFALTKPISFHVGSVDAIGKGAETPVFDTIFVPYLLGVKNGIEKTEDIVHFIRQLLTFAPKGRLLVNPSRNTKEFYLFGKQYFVTTGYANIQSIPDLKPYFIAEDKYWFRTQGLAVFAYR